MGYRNVTLGEYGLKSNLQFEEDNDIQQVRQKIFLYQKIANLLNYFKLFNKTLRSFEIPNKNYEIRFQL